MKQIISKSYIQHLIELLEMSKGSEELIKELKTKVKK